MIRNVISIVAGILTTFAVMMAFEFTNSFLFPFPSGFDTRDAAQIIEFINAHSPNLFFLVILGWLCGALAGGAVIARISQSQTSAPSIIAGAAVTLFQILNFQFLPHPIWAMAIGLIGMAPLYFLGYKFARPSRVSVSPTNG